MPGDLTVAITAVSSGSFALLGVALNQWTTTRRERRAFRTEAALELADMERLIWGDDWTDLQVHLHKHEARLAVAGVPEDLIHAFRRLSERFHGQAAHNRGLLDDDDTFVSGELTSAKTSVFAALRAHLLDEGGKSERKTQTAEAVRLVRVAYGELEAG